MSDNIILSSRMLRLYSLLLHVIGNQRQMIEEYLLDLEAYFAMEEQLFLFVSTCFFESPSLFAMTAYLFTVSLTERIETTPEGISFTNYNYWSISHPFLTDDDNPRTSYRAMYRMNRTTLERIINDLSQQPEFMSTAPNAIAPYIQITCAIWRLANWHVGYRCAHMTMGVSHGSYTNFTRRFVKAVIRVYGHLIQWPTDPVHAATIRREFKYGKVGSVVRGMDAIGAIDGKNIIISKRMQDPEEWRDRNNNFAMKLTAVCDSNCRFTYIRVGDSGKV